MYAHENLFFFHVNVKKNVFIHFIPFRTTNDVKKIYNEIENDM